MPSLGHRGRRCNLKSSPSEGRAFVVLLVANRNIGIPDGAHGVQGSKTESTTEALWSWWSPNSGRTRSFRSPQSNTWTVKFKHRNWSGKIKWVTKRGFATKREALQYERDFPARKSGDKQYQQLQQFNSVKIGKYEIAKTTFLMCIRQSMKNYLAKLNDLVSFGGGVLFYGMWKGYMEQPEMKEFPDWMTSKGVKVHILHTSGHTDSITIEKQLNQHHLKQQFLFIRKMQIGFISMNHQ